MSAGDGGADDRSGGRSSGEPGAWIRLVGADEAEGRLAATYRRIAGPGGEIDNIMLVHGLRPHTLDGHMALYKAVLHHPRNALPRWLLETLGVWVSALNGCAYCVDHHLAGLTRLVGEARADAVAAAIAEGAAARSAEPLGAALEPREVAACRYALRLTLAPAELDPGDVGALRRAGYDDGEILEIDQVVAYFAYANRTVLGLGVSTAGDRLGTSPSGEGWEHR